MTIHVNVARSPEEAELQAQGVDVMAEMFEKDTPASPRITIRTPSRARSRPRLRRRKRRRRSGREARRGETLRRREMDEGYRKSLVLCPGSVDTRKRPLPSRRRRPFSLPLDKAQAGVQGRRRLGGTMLKLIIGNKAYSSWSLRGWLAVKQSGLAFEEITVPLFDEAWEKTREGNEFAPSGGKVPVLWDDQAVIWDSLAIVEWLADKTDRDRYWPEGRGRPRHGAVDGRRDAFELRQSAPRMPDEPQEAIPGQGAVGERPRRGASGSSSCGRRRGPGTAAAALICSARSARSTSCSRRSSPASSLIRSRCRASPPPIWRRCSRTPGFANGSRRPRRSPG